MYARARRLEYFSTECKYAPHAYRGHARAYIKDLEKLRPRSILGALLNLTLKSNFLIIPYIIFPAIIIDIISSGEQMVIKEGVKVPIQGMLLLSHVCDTRMFQGSVFLVDIFPARSFVRPVFYSRN